jgi:hypothetical protein
MKTKFIDRRQGKSPKDKKAEFVPSGNWCNCCERYDCGCIEASRRDRELDRGRR